MTSLDYVNGYSLMTLEQQLEWGALAEAAGHSDTFTGLDAIHLAEYEAQAKRLEAETWLEARLLTD